MPSVCANGFAAANMRPVTIVTSVPRVRGLGRYVSRTRAEIVRFGPDERAVEVQRDQPDPRT
jgi:hypothetical protein